MPKTQKVMQTLHDSMVDMFALMNRPQHDDTLLREPGVSMVRAQFPLLVGIGGPVPIGQNLWAVTTRPTVGRSSKSTSLD